MMEFKSSPAPSIQTDFKDIVVSSPNETIGKCSKEKVVDTLKNKVDGATNLNGLLKTVTEINSCSTNLEIKFNMKANESPANGMTTTVGNENEDEMDLLPSNSLNTINNGVIEAANLNSLETKNEENNPIVCDQSDKIEEDQIVSKINDFENIDKIITSEEDDDADQLRDPGDDLDTLLSKINDLVEDCMVTKGSKNSLSNSINEPTISDSSSITECTDDSVILLNSSTVEIASATAKKGNDESLEEYSTAKQVGKCITPIGEDEIVIEEGESNVLTNESEEINPNKILEGNNKESGKKGEVSMSLKNVDTPDNALPKYSSEELEKMIPSAETSDSIEKNFDLYKKVQLESDSEPTNDTSDQQIEEEKSYSEMNSKPSLNIGTENSIDLTLDEEDELGIIESHSKLSRTDEEQLKNHDKDEKVEDEKSEMNATTNEGDATFVENHTEKVFDSKDKLDDDYDNDVVILYDDDDYLLTETEVDDVTKTAKPGGDVSLDEISDESLDDDAFKKINECSLDAISNDALDKTIDESEEQPSLLDGKRTEKENDTICDNATNENSLNIDNSDNACDEFDKTDDHEIINSNDKTDKVLECCKKPVSTVNADSNSCGSSSNLLKEAQPCERNSAPKDVDDVDGENDDNLDNETAESSQANAVEIVSRSGQDVILECDDVSKMETDAESNIEIELEFDLENQDHSKSDDKVDLHLEEQMSESSRQTESVPKSTDNEIEEGITDFQDQDADNGQPPSKRLRLVDDSEFAENTQEIKVDDQKTSTEILVDENSNSVHSDMSTKTSLKRSHSRENIDALENRITVQSSENKKTKADEDVIVITPSDDETSRKEEIESKDDDNNLLEDRKIDHKICLYPPPKFSDTPAEKINLQFLKRFKKSIGKMTKNDLEELVLEKIVEGIVHKSEFCEMHELLEKQEKIISSHRAKISELVKQFRDLEMVHNRVLKDLEMKNSQFIMPVKITRAVGLQVFIPHKKTDAAAGVVGSGIIPSSSSSSSSSPSSSSSNAINSFITQQPAHLTRSMAAANHFSSESSPSISSYANASGITYARKTPPVALNSTTGVQQRRGCVQKLTPMRPDTPQNMATMSTPAQRYGSPTVTTQYNASTNHLHSMSNQMKDANNMKLLNKSISFTRNRVIPTPNGGYQSQQSQQNQLNLPKGLLSSTAINVVRKSLSMNTSRTQQQKSSVDAIPPNLSGNTNIVKRSAQTAHNTSIVTGAAQTNLENISTLPSTMTTAKPKVKSVIDLTDEDDAPSVITAPASLPPSTTILRKILPASQTSTNMQQTTIGLNQAEASVANSYAMNKQIIAQPRMANKMMSSQQASRQQATSSEAYGKTSGTLGNSLPASTSITRLRGSTHITTASKQNHPAPLPAQPTYPFNPSVKLPPQRPTIHIDNRANGIVISWTMGDSWTTADNLDRFAECTSYQIYAYQEIAGPAMVESWRHVGDVKAMLLPMAVTLTQFQEGQRYYFAVRAIDVHGRYGPFSLPKTWS